MKMIQRNKQEKNDVHVTIHGKKPFITPIRRTDEYEPWENDYGYNKGTICLVSR